MQRLLTRVWRTFTRQTPLTDFGISPRDASIPMCTHCGARRAAWMWRRDWLGGYCSDKCLRAACGVKRWHRGGIVVCDPALGFVSCAGPLSRESLEEA